MSMKKVEEQMSAGVAHEEVMADQLAGVRRLCYGDGRRGVKATDQLHWLAGGGGALLANLSCYLLDMIIRYISFILISILVHVHAL